MGKTRRRQPMGDDDRWIRKGGKHRGPSRKVQKQKFERNLDDDFNY